MQGAVGTYLRKEGREEGMEGGRKDALYFERMRKTTDFNAEVGVSLPQITGSRATIEVVRDCSPVGQTPGLAWQFPQDKIPPKGCWPSLPD